MKQQLLFPGMGPASQLDLATRRAADAMKPKAAQLPCDLGIFSDDARQIDLVDEARRLAAVDRATDPPAKPKRSAAPRKPRKRGPVSLLRFLASCGGIRNDDPLIADVRSILGERHRLIRPPRELSTAAQAGGVQAPKFLDGLREAAVAAGYLLDTPWRGGVAITTATDLLELMDKEARGAKQYPWGEGRSTARPFDPAEYEHWLEGNGEAAVGAATSPRQRRRFRRAERIVKTPRQRAYA